MGYSTRIYQSLSASYLALLVGPTVPAVGAAVTGVSAYQWPLFSLGGLVGAGVGYVLATRIDVLRWLTRTWVAVLVTILPLWYLIWLIALFAFNPGRSLLTILVRPGTLGMFGFAVALVAVVLATRQTTVERIERSSVYTSFQSGPSRRRRRIRYGVFAIGLGGVAGLLTVLTMYSAVSSTLLAAAVLAMPLSMLGLYAVQDRTVVLTDDGLAIDGTFTEWEHFAEYDLTDRTLVLTYRSQWAGTLALDLSAVPDLDSVRDPLEEHVDQA
ncbi:MAG: hypothetical protein ABEI77_03955 [Halorientalis sp.]